MSIFTDFEALMHSTADDLLGDDIEYSTAGGAFTTLRGYVIFPDSGSDFILDEMATTPNVKIAKALVAKPSMADRLTCVARLGASVWRPTTKRPQDSGAYWIFNIEKV